MMIVRDNDLNRGYGCFWRFFTLYNNEYVHLASFRQDSLNTTIVAEDGIIFTSATRRGTNLMSYQLEPGATELTKLTHWSRSGEIFGDGNAPRIYYTFYDQPITAEEFYAAQERYLNPPNPMQIDWIPIGQNHEFD